MISENIFQERNTAADYQTNFFVSIGVEADRERQWLRHFNDLLDTEAHPFSLNEKIIADLVQNLDRNTTVRNEGYWFTLARINELALLCAANYANNSEFSLVGDLLINPRLVLVHRAGSNYPVAKKRHVPLSVQFQDVGINLGEIREWLKKSTLVRVRTEALLPDLSKKLEGSGIFDQGYLQAVEQRKKRIVDLLGFLAAGGITDQLSLRNWLENATLADRQLMEARFCPLDLDWFFEMGRRTRE